MLQEGRLQRLLGTPDFTQEVDSWLPRPDITGNPTLELGHVHALHSSLSKGMAKALGGTQALILYTWVYHLVGFHDLTPPSQVPAEVLKAFHTRIGRSKAMFEQDLEKACKRRKQNEARGCNLATLYSAIQEEAVTRRRLHVPVNKLELRHFLPETARPPCVKAEPGEQAFWPDGSCVLCMWGSDGYQHCGAAVGMCAMCSASMCCGSEWHVDDGFAGRIEGATDASWECRSKLMRSGATLSDEYDSDEFLTHRPVAHKRSRLL
jgi:hypothetical protein